MKVSVSRLAVAGVVLALVPCCPLTGMIGAFLGVLAMRQIRLSEGRVVGSQLALLAVVLGIGLSFLWLGMLQHYTRSLVESDKAAMAERTAELIEAAQDQRAAAVLEAWSADDAGKPTEAEILAFGRAMRERYGRFDRFSIISTSQSGGLFTLIYDVTGRFHFKEGDVLGLVRFRGEAQLPQWQWQKVFSPLEIHLEDSARGDLQLGGETEGDPPGNADESARDEDEAGRE